MLILLISRPFLPPGLSYLQFIQTVSDQKMVAGKIWEDEARLCGDLSFFTEHEAA